VRRDQLADVPMTFNKVTTMTADFSKPSIVFTGKLVVPADFKQSLVAGDKFAVHEDYRGHKLVGTPGYMPLFVQSANSVADAA
jgi:hypothetical protein